MAFQISEVPVWALFRTTRVQVRPAPLTVAVCATEDGPSEATNASSSSFAAAVLKAAVVTVPRPSRYSSASIETAAPSVLETPSGSGPHPADTHSASANHRRTGKGLRLIERALIATSLLVP